MPKFFCWDKDHGEIEIEARSHEKSAEHFAAEWWSAADPEADRRVHVSSENGTVLTFDVFVEEIEVSFYTEPVSKEELDREATR